jgi:hypothetical protein
MTRPKIPLLAILLLLLIGCSKNIGYQYPIRNLISYNYTLEKGSAHLYNVDGSIDYTFSDFTYFDSLDLYDFGVIEDFLPQISFYTADTCVFRYLSRGAMNTIGFKTKRDGVNIELIGLLDTITGEYHAIQGPYEFNNGGKLVYHYDSTSDTSRISMYFGNYNFDNYSLKSGDSLIVGNILFQYEPHRVY